MQMFYEHTWNTKTSKVQHLHVNNYKHGLAFSMSFGIMYFFCNILSICKKKKKKKKKEIKAFPVTGLGGLRS
jgi:hypothetical protein